MNIVAVPQTGYRILITVTDIPDTATEITISRNNLQDPTRTVRGWNHVTPNGSTAVAVDTEGTFNTYLMYTAEIVNADGTTSSVVTATVLPWTGGTPFRPMISDPVSGAYVVLSALSQWPDVTREARSAAIELHGQPYPAVVSDVMSAGTSQMVFRTDDPYMRSNLAALLESGRVLLYRDSTPGLTPALYFSVTKWVEQRLTNSPYDYRRHHQLDVVHTDQPEPGTPAIGDTLADLAMAVPGTLNDIANRWGTLLDIATTDLGAA